MTSFYNIYTESGIEITDHVVGFSYEEAQDKEDMLTLRMRDNTPTLSLISDDELIKGKRLIFVFGVVGGKQSGKKYARIINKTRRYGSSGAVMDIQAFDDGYVLKKKQWSTVWKDKTISEIMLSIAGRNGLNTKIESTNIRYGHMPQGNRTDWDFCKYLAGIEKDGSMRFYVRNGVLNFTRLELEKESIRAYEYGADGNIISLDIREQGSTQSSGADSTEAVSYDPLTGKTYQKKVDSGNAVDDIKLGRYDINDKGELGELKPGNTSKTNPSSEQSGVLLPVVADSQQETSNIANQIKKSSAMEGYKASLTIALDPTISPDVIISIKGVSIVDSGNYYILSTKHDIANGGGRTVLELRKNAASKKALAGQEQNSKSKTNDKVADSDSDKKSVPLVVIDENGNIIK